MKRNSLLATLMIIAISFPITSSAQSSASFGQAIAVLKTLKTNLEVLGVMSSVMTDKDVANITRAAQQQGLKIFVAKVNTPQEISQLYKKLVNDKKAQIILIPTADDEIMLHFGFDFLKENTVVDKIGLCVPDVSYLAQGALCFITKENGKLRAYVNQRISTFVGATIPQEENSSIDYVLK